MDGLTLPPPTKIVGVGRNYMAHAAELGNEVPERPLLFLKPPSALIRTGEPIVLPPESEQVEYEGEIAVLVGARCRNVPEGEALAHLAGVAALNDVTARDLQRSDGHWIRAKGFDTFCSVGSVAPAEDVRWEDLEVVTTVDGEVRQHGRAADMAFSIPTLVSYVSRTMTLMPGDILTTGTPEGVAPLKVGMAVTVDVKVGGSVLSSVSNPVAG